MALNFLESMLTLCLRARTFKYVSVQKEAFKLGTSRKKMKSSRASIKKATKKLEFGDRTTKSSFLKNYI